MSGNGRLQLPGQVGVNIQHLPGPTSQPATVVLQQPGGVQVLIIGGMSPYEQSVMQVAAGLAQSIKIEFEDVDTTTKLIAELSMAVVDAVGRAISAKAVEVTK